MSSVKDGQNSFLKFAEKKTEKIWHERTNERNKNKDEYVPCGSNSG